MREMTLSASGRSTSVLTLLPLSSSIAEPSWKPAKPGAHVSSGSKIVVFLSAPAEVDLLRRKDSQSARSDCAALSPDCGSDTATAGQRGTDGQASSTSRARVLGLQLRHA
jgi:hypothetical protein